MQRTSIGAASRSPLGDLGVKMLAKLEGGNTKPCRSTSIRMMKSAKIPIARDGGTEI
jgi:hypothetical protein